MLFFMFDHVCFISSESLDFVIVCLLFFLICWSKVLEPKWLAFGTYWYIGIAMFRSLFGTTPLEIAKAQLSVLPPWP